MKHQTNYLTTKVDGLTIFYREAGRREAGSPEAGTHEAGSPDAPTILFLHGFPSSSRMFESLFPLLSEKYHLVAPDYPGFGYSDMPPKDLFPYTFDHLATIMTDFAQALGLTRYILFMQDYGGPVGMRMAEAHPEMVAGMIIQNAVSHEEGLSPLWEVRKAYWKDRAGHEAALRSNFTSLEATRQRHIGNSPHPERIDPDTWNDEFAYLSRPGVVEVQLDLFYDYQTNVASYPRWQQWLREHQPPLLVLWGTYDPSFTVAGGNAYKKDLPGAEVVLLEAGHFALDEATDEIARYLLDFRPF